MFKVCEVCYGRREVGIVLHPISPLGYLSCAECWQAQAVPVWMLTATSVVYDSLLDLPREYKEALLNTLIHLRLTFEEYRQKEEGMRRLICVAQRSVGA